MGIIRVLEQQLANKIAAGEVVERPASVVRELLENSLDAGARNITVDVERAGRKLIRVADDGCGMDEADAAMSVERHATSKITDEADLFRIGTMGFRGEALPSIASVSRLLMRTAPEGAEHGHEFNVVGGEAGEPVPVATVGTTVEVRDLFFNTPARRKFLKRDQTELMHIVETVTKLALSHPGAGFTLTVEGQPTVDLPRARDLHERLVQVYGTEFVEELVGVSRHEGPLKVEGFVSPPSGLRETRTHQLLFINRRPVRDPSVSHAVFSAYDAPKGLHPVFFIFLDIDPEIVDVNVHPAKQEVRFSDKSGLYRFVRRAVGEVVRPLSGGEYLSQEDAAFPAASSAYGSDNASVYAYEHANASPSGTFGVSEALPGSYGEAGGFAGNFRAQLPFVYLGETFIAYPEVKGGKGGLAVLDHHAAHERVLFEQLLDGLRMESKRLLFPRQVQLSKKEHMVVLDNLEMLAEFGLEVEDFGGDSVIVRSLPGPLEEADLRGILSEAVAAILEGDKPGRSIQEAVAARVACHSSVRGATVLGPEEFNALLEQLDRARDPEHCPHGRPTRLRFSFEELRKLFKRS
ncbi:MAG: DNA mismatch repair endonuclease MutL [Thermodesulfovibrionales bacterium]|nr:DNA mismatch repair endonuclease MutL [Thermodesulfovibrionales bacterium]